MSDVIVNKEDRNVQAIRLHNQIMVAGNMVVQYYSAFCRDLKRMRDEKLYIELGCESFDEYCEKQIGVGARQGYTYIQTYENLGSEVLDEHSNLGITKLSLLTKMPPLARTEALESGELEGMSVKEVKELVAKSTYQSEQLSLLTEEVESLKSENEALKNDNEDYETENSELEEMFAKLKQEVKDLKERPTEIAPEPSEEQIEAIRQEFEAEKQAAIKAEKDKTDKKIAKAKADAEKAANAAKEKEIAEAVKKAKAEAAEKNKELNTTIERLTAEQGRLEKELKASDSNVQKVIIYLGAFQDNLNKTLGIINKLPEEQKKKMLVAVKSAITEVLKQIGG